MSFESGQRLGMAAAIGATGLGIAVMAAAGAPNTYLAVNLAALVIGLALVAFLRRNRITGQGWLMLAAAAGLLATALFGTTTEGVTRWVRIGVVTVQPGLVLLPLMLLTFARDRDNASTLAMLVTAAALALQPDRAMAGALLAGLVALALTARDRQGILALAAALAGFAVTLAQPDTLPPTEFVEQVYTRAFGVSVLAGLAVVVGSVLLLLPLLTLDPIRASVFAAVWLAILAASVLGNYPTPLLGYGGSGIIGYLLCLAALRPKNLLSTGKAAAAEPGQDTGFDGSAFAAR